MPRDNLSNDLNTLSEEVSDISFKMSDGESMLKKTMYAFFENSRVQAGEKVQTLNKDIASMKGFGLFDWIGNLFGGLFNRGKNKTLAEESRAAVANVSFDSSADLSTDQSLSSEESMRDKMRNAGYRSIVENIDNDIEKTGEKTKESQNNDFQQ